MKEAREEIAQALPGWTVVWEGARRLWLVRSPSHILGLVIEGRTPEDIIQRASAVSWALLMSGVDVHLAR